MQINRTGYLVIAIDAFYFGERRLRVEELEPSRVFTEVRDAFNLTRTKTPGSSESPSTGRATWILAKPPFPD